MRPAAHVAVAAVINASPRAGQRRLGTEEFRTGARASSGDERKAVGEDGGSSHRILEHGSNDLRFSHSGGGDIGGEKQAADRNQLVRRLDRARELVSIHQILFL